MNKTIKIFYLALLAFLLNGCSVWYDFSTYFNIYYNTKDAFQQAEKIINTQKRSIFSNEVLLIPANAIQLLTKVNEKCSKILQFHNKSSYVKNALMMIGKSFYYQKNYLKAIRKFDELKQTQPDQETALETDLWIGKTQIALRDFDKGTATLNKLIEDAGKLDEPTFVIQGYTELIKYFIYKNEKVAAIDYINKLVAFSNDDEKNAEAVYEKGKLYVELNDNKNAISSFEEIYNYSPLFEVEINAKLALGKAYRDQGNNEKALKLFEDMALQNKFTEKKDFIELEIGSTLILLNKVNDALEILTKVDTGYANSPNSSIARFKKAEIYEKYLNNFDSAAVYYLKSLNSNPPKDFLPLVQQKDQLFKKYKILSSSISHNQRLKLYLLDSTVFVSDSLKYIDSLKVLSEIDRRKALDDSLNNFSKQPGTNKQQGNINVNVHPEVLKPQKPSIPLDSINRMLVKSKLELANLFFTEFRKPDSAFYYYSNILDEHKGSSYEARTLYSLGSYYLTIQDTVKSDSLFEIIYKDFSQESVANAVALKLNKPLIENLQDKTKVVYHEAEKELKQGNYQNAVDKFYGIFKANKKSPYAAQALYAAGYILENDLRNADSAAAVYDTLMVNYSATTYGQKIIQKVITYRQEKERIKIAFEDSLKAIEKKKTDSLALIQKRIDSVKTSKLNLNDSLKVLQNKNVLPIDTIKNVEVLSKEEMKLDSVKNNQLKLKKKLESLKNKAPLDSSNNIINKTSDVDSLNIKQTVIQDSSNVINKTKTNEQESGEPNKTNNEDVNGVIPPKDNSDIPNSRKRK